MAKMFRIDGFWKDDKSEFSGALVYEYDECPDHIDVDSVFYFGMNESDIKAAIKGEDDALDFGITSYEEELC